MRLPAHGLLLCAYSCRHDVEDWAVGRKQHVESALEFILVDLVAQVLDKKTVKVQQDCHNSQQVHSRLVWATNILRGWPVCRCFGGHFRSSPAIPEEGAESRENIEMRDDGRRRYVDIIIELFASRYESRERSREDRPDVEKLCQASSAPLQACVIPPSTSTSTVLPFVIPRDLHSFPRAFPIFDSRELLLSPPSPTMSGPEIHHLFHKPIADHSSSADRQTLAVAKDNVAEIYARSGSKFVLKDELKGHDKTVTGVDIAPNSGMIVTCSQGKPPTISPNPDAYRMQIGMPTSGNPLPQAGSPPSSFSASTVPPPSSAGHPPSVNSLSVLAPALSRCATSKKRMTGGYPSTSRSPSEVPSLRSVGTRTLFCLLQAAQTAMLGYSVRSSKGSTSGRRQACGARDCPSTQYAAST